MFDSDESSDEQYIKVMEGSLILEDGTTFHGSLHGAYKSANGEIVFQTGMVGYCEALTDPSYHKQFLTLTYPLIGNYGVPDPKIKDKYNLPKFFESDKIWPSALIVDRLCPENEHSHSDAIQSLSQWLASEGVPLLSGIDTRALTKKIRESGSMKAKLVIDAEDPKKMDFVDINKDNLVEEVSRKEPTIYGTGAIKILAIDCGLKYNQIRCLCDRNVTVKVVPYNYPIENETDYDGIFLSNGPGDPSMVSSLIKSLSKILLKPNCKPVFGICMGHQMLAKAIGAETYKLKYGNRGHNQPCTHTDTGRCFITSQNHGFAVKTDTLPSEWIELFINENDKTNEGICHKSKPFFSVQFHPEHSAGPTDMVILFDVFIEAVKKAKAGENFVVRDLIKDKLYYESIYKIEKQTKVLILGSGGLTIGQAGEFDYSGAQAIKALKERGIYTVLINPNVATVQTAKGFADNTYFLPVTKEYVTDVIKKERPSGILCTFGGQTALNCAVDLYRDKIFEKYNVQVLGTSIDTIITTEDRERFNEEIKSIGEQVAPSKAATSIEDAITAAEQIGYPVLVRAAFALGGLGSGFANNASELQALAQKAFAYSNQVLIDKSLLGFKEVEYEVVRDAYDNCITVCNMENVDPVGIHTGESIVVAPSQTLNDVEYNALRETAVKVIRHFGIIGECNIQYALDPNKLDYYIIEVNARLSRSSALASKATGYPLAYIAAKLSLGERLSDLRNTVTQETTACFEPSLDYCVVKIPRWDLSKFARVSTKIGSSMKSVGEVMGIGRSFEEAFQKALRMVNDHYEGFTPFLYKNKKLTPEFFTCPTDRRVDAIAYALFNNIYTLEEIHQWTKIDRFFLYRMQNIIEIYKRIQQNGETLSKNLLLEAKKAGFSDIQIARTVKTAEKHIRRTRKQYGIMPVIKQIDTVAAEWPATTNYLYLTYNGTENDVVPNTHNSVVVLGSGVYRIGSSVEFDACCVGCVKELKKLDYKTIMINCNPETVSTDYDICDRLYFEEISVEVVATIYEFERPKGIILAFGGQAPNNIAKTLTREIIEPKIHIFGTSPDSIDNAENRHDFSRALDELRRVFKDQIKQPRWKNAQDAKEAEAFCDEVGYPCLIRPSYVLSGAAMNVAHNKEDLKNFLDQAVIVAKDRPVVVSKFIGGAKEIDVDAVAKNGAIICMAVCEHIENAGIHSGDATLVCPPFDLTPKTIDQIKFITAKIAEKLKVNGPFNMQLIAKDDELYVIECNLRASRSFPFVSKTLDYDFIAAATCVMMDKPVKVPEGVMWGRGEKFGVKVPQFSFPRLAGADVIQGVEMVSTGEVACYGKDHRDAYLKGLLATGFVLPKKNIFLSFGGVTTKSEMLESVKILSHLGFDLFASKGTADYYNNEGINVRAVEWPFEEGSEDDHGTSSSAKTAAFAKNVADYVENKDFHLVINLPIKGSGAYRVSAYRTQGYKTRRMAVDNGIPLLTDIKCAKLFVKALEQSRNKLPPFNSQLDAISSMTLKRLPGLIDIHVHFREPGGEHKETWITGSKAAVAGGITLVCAMPNTSPPLIDAESFEIVEAKASAGSIVDYALFIGATPDNSPISAELAKKVAGMKMYLNETFATLRIPNVTDWMKHFETFPSGRPIVCHAEKQTLAAVLAVAQLSNRHVHICHIATKEEIEIIKKAKDSGWNVTCEVCPHHLIFSESDLPENIKEVRPRLASANDAKALWENLDYIDCFATDHAPHTPEEKEKGTPGYPGVEYMLPLLLTKVKEKKLTMKQLIDRLYTNPRKIFNLPEQPDTYVEVAIDEEWIIPENGGHSKAGWTPFAGMKVIGKVRSVVIRGKEVYIDGNIIEKPGFGQNIRLLADSGASAVAVGHGVEHDETSRPKSRMAQDSVEIIEEAGTPSPKRALTPDDNPLYQRDILNVEMFTKDHVQRILEQAEKCRKGIENREIVGDELKGRVMGSMFYENSTRTKCSFDAAMKRFGGGVVDFIAEASSIKKGESFEDTISMMDGYSDVIVLRHPEVGAAERAAAIANKPVINAGDGTGQHPTQALLDLFTIRTELSTINGVTIALVGDLKNGRTVHSLAKILCLYKNITLHFVSPLNAGLEMPKSIIEYIKTHAPNFSMKTFTSFAEGIRGVDVIYMTRIQKERFTNSEEYEKVKGSFILTPKILNESREDDEDYDILGRNNNKLPIVMHPLPRVDEIAPEVDADERAAYFRQAQNGVYIRMALLKMVLGNL